MVWEVCCGWWDGCCLGQGSGVDVGLCFVWMCSVFFFVNVFLVFFLILCGCVFMGKVKQILVSGQFGGKFRVLFNFFLEDFVLGRFGFFWYIFIVFYYILFVQMLLVVFFNQFCFGFVIQGVWLLQMEGGGLENILVWGF